MIHRFTPIHALVGATALSLGTIAAAGELVPENLPPDVRWFIHVDMEAARESTLGTMILDGDIDIDIDDVRSDIFNEIGIDPVTEVFDITLYSTEEDEDKAVIMFTATRAVDELLDHMQQDEVHYDTLEVNGREFHAWHDDETMYAHIKRDGKRRIVTLTGEAGRLSYALDVADGKANNIMSLRKPLLSHTPGDGTMLLIKVFELDNVDDDDPVSQILSRAEQLTVTVAERDRRVFGEIRLETEDADVLKDVADAVNGVIAIGRLMAQNEEELKPLLDITRNLNVSTSDNELTLKLDCTVKQLKALESLDEHHHDHEDHEH